MLVTIQEIAEKANLPVKTVARALSGETMGKRRDARERAERVLKIAEELGYQPSNIAQSLRHGKTRTIGLVIGGLANNYFGRFVECVLDELDKKGYRLLIEVTKWDQEKELECLKNLLRYRVDGIINLLDLPGELSSEHKMIMKKEYPFLTLYPNEHGFKVVQNDLSIGINDSLKYLAEKGNKDIAIVFYSSQSYQRKLLTEQFKKECKKLHLNGTTYCLDASFSNIKEVLDSRHQGLLIMGPNVLNHVADEFKNLDKTYQPDIIGFYDEFNWDIHHDTICGAVITQTKDVIKTAIENIIDWIENSDIKQTESIGIPSTFYNSDSFDEINIEKPSVLNLSQL